MNLICFSLFPDCNFGLLLLFQIIRHIYEDLLTFIFSEIPILGFLI
jgi:hypothetical protein